MGILDGTGISMFRRVAGANQPVCVACHTDVEKSVRRPPETLYKVITPCK